METTFTTYFSARVRVARPAFATLAVVASLATPISAAAQPYFTGLCYGGAADATHNTPDQAANMRNHGGSNDVLHSPRVHNIFLDLTSAYGVFGNFYSTSSGSNGRTRANSWSNVFNLPAYWSAFHEWGIGIGSYAGMDVLVYADSITTPTPANDYSTAGGAGNGRFQLSPNQYSQILEHEFNTGILPPPNGNDIYVFYLQPGIIMVEGSSCTGSYPNATCSYPWDGVHDSYTRSNGIRVAWAEIDNGSPNFGGALPSHEVGEASTDPFGGGVYNDNGLEIGDMCNYALASPYKYNTNLVGLLGGGYAVQYMWSQAACRCALKSDTLTDDLDGDGISDITLYTPSTGEWTAEVSYAGNVASKQWGMSGDWPVAADYDGDWRTDFAVWRPSDPYNGNVSDFIVSTSTSNYASWMIRNVGSSTDRPVPADFDGDGLTDPATWTPSTGNWNVLMSARNYQLVVTQWGMSGDVPIPGDYDGDGIVDYAVFRDDDPWSSPTAHLSDFIALLSTTNWNRNAALVWSPGFKVSSAVPAPGDFDGDGITDFCYFKTDVATFTWRSSESPYNVTTTTTFGATYNTSSFPLYPIPRPWTYGSQATFATRNSYYSEFYWDPNNVDPVFPSGYFSWGGQGDVPAQVLAN